MAPCFWLPYRSACTIDAPWMRNPSTIPAPAKGTDGAPIAHPWRIFCEAQEPLRGGGVGVAAMKPLEPSNLPDFSASGAWCLWLRIEASPWNDSCRGGMACPACFWWQPPAHCPSRAADRCEPPAAGLVISEPLVYSAHWLLDENRPQHHPFPMRRRAFTEKNHPWCAKVAHARAQNPVFNKRTGRFVESNSYLHEPHAP